jgi:hypothetical protein
MDRIRIRNCTEEKQTVKQLSCPSDMTKNMVKRAEQFLISGDPQQPGNFAQIRMYCLGPDPSQRFGEFLFSHNTKTEPRYLGDMSICRYVRVIVRKF